MAKRKTQYQQLTGIIKKLNDYEIRYFRDQLGLNKGSKGKNTELSLFNTLVKNPDLPPEKAREKFYPKNSKRSFERAIQKLRTTALETILADQNLRNDQYSKHTITKIQCNKELLLAYLMLGRGLEEESLEMYRKVVKTAKEFELYEEFIEALHHLTLIERLIHQKPYKEREQIPHYLEGLEAQYQTAEYYHEFFGNSNFKGNPNQKLKFLENVLPKIKKFYEKFGEPRLALQFFGLAIEYFHTKYNFNAIQIIIKKSIRLVKYSSYFGNRLLGNLYVQMVFNEMHLLNFDQSCMYANIANELLEKDSFDYFSLKKYQVFNYFYQGKLQEAREILEETLKNKRVEEFPFRKNILNYLLANIYFIQKDYGKSMEQLATLEEIDRDKEGWNLGIRRLTILNFLEMEDSDQADFHIESFRKFIQRNRTDIPFRKRDHLIQKILSSLKRLDYNYSATLKERKSELEKLSGDSPEHCWLVASPELVIFHQWFEAKANGKNYEPNYTIFRSKGPDEPMSELEKELLLFASE